MMKETDFRVGGIYLFDSHIRDGKRQSSGSKFKFKVLSIIQKTDFMYFKLFVTDDLVNGRHTCSLEDGHLQYCFRIKKLNGDDDEN